MLHCPAPQASAPTCLPTRAGAVAVVLVGLPQRFHGGLVGVDAFVGDLLHAQPHGCRGGLALHAVWGLGRGRRLGAGISCALLCLSCERKQPTCEFNDMPFKNLTANILINGSSAPFLLPSVYFNPFVMTVFALVPEAVLSLCESQRRDFFG